MPAKDDLQTKFLAQEYDYLVESSFHTDELRDRFIQFYLVIVGAAITAVVGLAKPDGANPSQIPMWVFSAITFFIGAIGVIMLPIFARLRRVVLECMQGTVLIKAYTGGEIPVQERKRFSSALIWDARSLPVDESSRSASFLLIFIFMFLDSAMWALGAGILLYDRQPASHLSTVLGTLAVFVFALALQVNLYRWWLRREITSAMTSDQLREKWADLGLASEVPVSDPAWDPLNWGFVLGMLVAIGGAFLAWFTR